MSIHDFPSVRDASFTDAELDELVNSRHAGESELHWLARITRIACEHWLIADTQLKQAEVNGNNWEIKYKLAGYERKRKHTMTTYALMLAEALTEKAA